MATKKHHACEEEAVMGEVGGWGALGGQGER